MELFGQWSESVAEGLDFGAMSGFEVVYKLLVDDGLEHRPHRKAIMNPIYNQVGVAAGPHEEFITMVSVILSHDF